MMQFGPNGVFVQHPREPWFGAANERVHVHSFWDRVNGSSPTYATAEKAQFRERYRQAKREFDMDAAYDIIDSLINEEVLTDIINDAFGGWGRPLIVVPHPSFDDDDAIDQNTPNNGPTNAIPFAFSGYLEAVLSLRQDDEIVQSARVGRTKLGNFLRFLCQPAFSGRVERGQAYLIADDVVTTAGTLAALRSYIIRNGGVVVATTALAHKAGRSFPFGIGRATLDVLRSKYGNGLVPYWQETFGHGLDCLTENEGQFLVFWGDQQIAQGTPAGDGLLQRLRDRINQAAGTGG